MLPNATSSKEIVGVFQNPVGLGKATIKIVVDFTIPVCGSYLTTHISSEDEKIDGAWARTSEHRGISKGYPICNMLSWKNSEGKTLLEWLEGLADGGHLIPTDKEKNGGKTSYQIQRDRWVRSRVG